MVETKQIRSGVAQTWPNATHICRSGPDFCRTRNTIGGNHRSLAPRLAVPKSSSFRHPKGVLQPSKSAHAGRALADVGLNSRSSGRSRSTSTQVRAIPHKTFATSAHMAQIAEVGRVYPRLQTRATDPVKRTCEHPSTAGVRRRWAQPEQFRPDPAWDRPNVCGPS